MADSLSSFLDRSGRLRTSATEVSSFGLQIGAMAVSPEGRQDFCVASLGKGEMHYQNLHHGLP